MSTDLKNPETLIEAVRFFADEDTALEFAAILRWPDGEQVCPKCGSVGKHYFLKNQRRWKCRDCRKQFSIKVGTIFEDSPLALSLWLPAVWMLANCKNGISSYELARALGVTQKTAWFMLHRIREAMQDGDSGPFDGEVETDETYIGGLAKNMHKSKRQRVITGTGGKDKVKVMGFIQRTTDDQPSRVQTTILPDTRKPTMQGEVKRHVRRGSQLFTDRHWGYHGLDAEYIHEIIDHAVEHVRGRIHTNGIEIFWSLVKRTIHGTYVSVDPFHIRRYLDEQTFRFNERGDTDGGRFTTVLRSVIGKRLTYSDLTGAMLSRRPA